MFRIAIGTLALLLVVGCDRNSGAPPTPTTPVAQTTTTPETTGPSDPKPEDPKMALELKSSAFEPNGPMPTRYTCEGEEVSVPLQWSGAPEGTQGFVLIMDDPDAPDPAAPKMTWVHWVLYDIPAEVTSLAEGASKSVPAGTMEGTNSWDRTGYGGPCPPIGRHRYFHKLYALDAKLQLDNPDKDAVVAAMKGHVLASAELIGTYEKQKK